MRSISAKSILVVSEHFVGGGLETQLYGQARYLRAQGHKVHLVTSSSRSELADSAFDSTYFDVPMADVTVSRLLETTELLGDIIEKKMSILFIVILSIRLYQLCLQPINMAYLLFRQYTVRHHFLMREIPFLVYSCLICFCLELVCCSLFHWRQPSKQNKCLHVIHYYYLMP